NLSDQSGLRLGSATTRLNGAFDAIDPGGYTGPILVVVSVNGDSRYYDVTAKTEKDFPTTGLLPANSFFPDSGASRHVLFAMLPHPMENIGVTTLTTIATMLAAKQQKKEGAIGLLPSRIDNFNWLVNRSL